MKNFQINTTSIGQQTYNLVEKVGDGNINIFNAKTIHTLNGFRIRDDAGNYYLYNLTEHDGEHANVVGGGIGIVRGTEVISAAPYVRPDGLSPGVTTWDDLVAMGPNGFTLTTQNTSNYGNFEVEVGDKIMFIFNSNISLGGDISSKYCHWFYLEYGRNWLDNDFTWTGNKERNDSYFSWRAQNKSKMAPMYSFAFPSHYDGNYDDPHLEESGIGVDYSHMESEGILELVLKYTYDI